MKTVANFAGGEYNDRYVFCEVISDETAYEIRGAGWHPGGCSGCVYGYGYADPSGDLYLPHDLHPDDAGGSASMRYTNGLGVVRSGSHIKFVL